MAINLAVCFSSLYVGDLHPDVHENELVNVFSEVPGVQSVRICRDSVTSRSLGYAYVNYLTLEQASQAIQQLNYTLLRGRPIRIMWSNRDPESRKTGNANLFVKNLEATIDTKSLHAVFAPFGQISSCKLAITPDGKSKGYGFVQYTTDKEAIAAIDQLNGSILGSKRLYVAYFIQKPERPTPSGVKNPNLYIKNIDSDIDQEYLYSRFSAFGKVVSLVIIKDNDGNSKGFGFVNFEEPDDAERAMEAMNGVQIGSKSLYVAKFLSKAEREKILKKKIEERRRAQNEKWKDSNVYIKNIAEDVRDDDLRQLFSSCGVTTSAKIIRDDNGISKGFGFVCFSTPEEAKMALEKYNGCMFHAKPLYLSIAQKKEERKIQLQRTHALRSGAFPGPPTAMIPSCSTAYYSPQQGLMYQSIVPGWGGHHMSCPSFPSLSMLQNEQNVRIGDQKNRSSVKSVPSNPLLQSKLAELKKRILPLAPRQQKEILRNQLPGIVKEVQVINVDHADKITAMLLGMDNNELMKLMGSAEALSSKVVEIMHMLELSQVGIDTGFNGPIRYLPAQVAVN